MTSKYSFTPDMGTNIGGLYTDEQERALQRGVTAGLEWLDQQSNPGELLTDNDLLKQVVDKAIGGGSAAAVNECISNIREAREVGWKQYVANRKAFEQTRNAAR